MNARRNLDEILRLARALQIADGNVCASPVNWQPDEKVVVPPPKTAADVKERLSHQGKDDEVKDVYLCVKDLPQT